MQDISLDTVISIPYIKKTMLPKFTTCMILMAITVQAVFGGLQNSVSICLGGGHEHEVTEVVEQCELECNHHSDWPTPISSSVDIDDCGCTDFEFGLITLLSTSRTHDNVFLCTILTIVANDFTLDTTTPLVWRGPPDNQIDDFGMMNRIAVVRSTRLRV